MPCHSLQTGHGCSGRLRFLFSISFDLEPPAAGPAVLAPRQAGHRHLAPHALPGALYQPFHLIGQRRQEALRIERPHTDAHLVPICSRKARAPVSSSRIRPRCQWTLSR